MSKRNENTPLNDLAPVNYNIKLMTSVVVVQMVDHTETERNTRQIEVGLALVVDDHLFQKLAVDFRAVSVHSGGIVNLLYVVPYSVKLLLMCYADILALRYLLGQARDLAVVKLGLFA